MTEEIVEIYFSISALLDDICKFLKDGVNKEALDPDARKLADSLINRSKAQLRSISTLITTTDGDDYVQMKNSSSGSDKEEPSKNENWRENAICPYIEFPVKDLPHEEKSGYVSFKTKFIILFERVRRVYAAVIDHWLLLYGNGKNSKPSHFYDLKIHKARILVTDKESEDNVQCFFLINLKTEETWQFEAQTNKDMLQWVANINKYSQWQPQGIDNSLQIDVSYDADNDETYDEVGKPELGEEDEEECIYADLGPSSQSVAHENIAPFKPPTPNILTIPSRILPPMPIPIPVSNEKTSSGGSFHNIPFEEEVESAHNSFSEESADSDDETYAPLSVIKLKPTPPLRKYEESIATTLVPEKEKRPVNKKPLTEVADIAPILPVRIEFQAKVAKQETSEINSSGISKSIDEVSFQKNPGVLARIAKLQNSSIDSHVEDDSSNSTATPTKGTTMSTTMFTQSFPTDKKILPLSTKLGTQGKLQKDALPPPPPPVDEDGVPVFSATTKPNLKSNVNRNDHSVTRALPASPPIKLSKPVVQVRIARPTINGKLNTKQVLKSVKESNKK